MVLRRRIACEYSVYTDLTDRSCGPGPGSGGHYVLDAKTIAMDWDADYLKVDYCGSSVSRDPAPQYAGFSGAQAIRPRCL